jgi:CopG family transcriptional regulator / antitoxin EndoAI
MARVLISMDDEFLELVDNFADREHRSRSELIREALRNYMRRSNFATSPRTEQEASSLQALLDA